MEKVETSTALHARRMIPSTHRNKSDHACASPVAPCVAAKPRQLMILNRWSAGSVRCAREYNRNAITVAAGMCGWIFSYAARRVWARVRSPSRPAGRSAGAARSNRCRCARSIRTAERPQPWPEMSHFGTEFFRILRESGSRLYSLLKFWCFGPSFLRCSVQRA